MNNDVVQEAPAAALTEEAREIVRRLSERPASIAPKYFYDRLGSLLFAAICETEEYYPTRTEASILPLAAESVRERLGTGLTLVDLGAGDCRKADRILPLLECERYLAIDISLEFMREALAAVSTRHKGVEMRALRRDLTRDWTLGESDAPGRRLFFYPGSSIGNFSPDEARLFLQRVCRNASDDGALLIGVDLIKERAVLEAAYDDHLGVTAAFNRNVLTHVNHLVGTDFDPRCWRHVAFFNEERARVEMHLEARRDLHLAWPGGGCDFMRGERIHTENSYKYTPRRFAQLLESAGWRVSARWSDARNWFALFLATPA